MKAVLRMQEEKNKIEYSFLEIKKFLVNKFLYEEDLECIHILLNIYNIEDSIENIFPSYISLKHLKKDIISFLKHKDGKELIAYNLSQLIHDDVNRFELYIYLEAYRNGFNSFKNANKLEILTFKYFDVEELYNFKHLFNYENNKEDILKLKSNIFNNITKSKQHVKFLKSNINRYNREVLSPKIKNLNNHIDRQIIFNYESIEEKFIETNNHLNKKELYGLNKKLLNFLFHDSFKIYKNAYWDGINDQVIKRYR